MNKMRQRAVEQAIAALRALAAGPEQNTALDRLVEAFRREGGVSTQDSGGGGGNVPPPPPPPEPPVEPPKP